MSTILYVIEDMGSWINYAPALLKLARDNNAAVHVLDISAPLGAGTFTTASVWEPHNPDLERNDLASAPVPGDIKLAGQGEKSALQEVADYLASAGIEAEAHLKPEMPPEQVIPYARSVGADILAHSELGRVSGWLRGGLIKEFERAGFRVVHLESSV